MTTDELISALRALTRAYEDLNEAENTRDSEAELAVYRSALDTAAKAARELLLSIDNDDAP